MPFSGNEFFRTRDDILNGMLNAWLQTVPEIWLGEDGILRIMLEIEAGQMENLYLTNQVVLEDMFVQSASFAALQRFGDTYGIPLIAGTQSNGSLLFEGIGGTYIPVGTEAAFDPGGGLDVIYFGTTEDGTLPDPGIPSAVTISDAALAGNLTGTFEYVVTFLTAEGETTQSPDSNPITVAASKINISNISIGGAGTIGRKLYRAKDGGDYQLVVELNDNTTTTYVDNIADGSLTAQSPPDESTAEQILLTASSEAVGTDKNVAASTVTILSNSPEGIASVINPQPFTGGTDQETVDAYRTRMLLAIRSPGTGSPNDLETWALQIPGITQVSVFPNDNLGTPTNGHVTVRVAGPNGTIPVQSVVDTVIATLNALDLANITIHVTTFTPVNTNVTVTITPMPNINTTDIAPQIQQAIENYILNVPAGGTVYVAGIYDAVFGLPGVATLVVNLPASDQTTSPTDKRVSGTITVN